MATSSEIETKILELQNCTIPLLLGTNVYKVLEANGFIPLGDSNGPFAIRFAIPFATQI